MRNSVGVYRSTPEASIIAMMKPNSWLIPFIHGVLLITYNALL